MAGRLDGKIVVVTGAAHVSGVTLSVDDAIQVELSQPRLGD